jgi:hypothetical protein
VSPNYIQAVFGESIMHMTEIPFGTTDWSAVEQVEHKGETGLAYWRTQSFGGIRVRMVEYTELLPKNWTGGISGF